MFARNQAEVVAGYYPSRAVASSAKRRVSSDAPISRPSAAACHPGHRGGDGRVLSDLGLNVRHNAPYAGGYTTGHYGAPHTGVHALQIEINRALYMDESRFERRRGLGVMAAHMATVIRALGAIDPAALSLPLAAE